MAAHFLFCPGSSDSKKQKSKASKFKHFSFKSIDPVDPLYETVPIQAKYSENSRGKHAFEQAGRQPLSFQQTPKKAATVLSSYASSSASQSQELSVESGETVYILYQDQGWSYVANKLNRRGYVPSGVLVGGREEDSSTAVSGTPFRSETQITNPSQSSPATPTDSVYSKVNKLRRPRSSSHTSASSRILTASPLQSSDNFHNSFSTFSKSPREIRALLYSYVPVQENDLTVRKGEQVTVLNNSDQEWLWVVRGDGEEGFIPASHSAPISCYSYGNGSIPSQPKHAKLSKQLSSSTGYRSSSSITNSINQMSAAFSDHVRVTPDRSLPHSPVDVNPPCHQQAISDPTADKNKSQRRTPSREIRSRTPDSLSQRRTNSSEFTDKKYRNAISPVPRVSEIQRTSSLQRPCNSSDFTAQDVRQLVYNHPVQRPTRPAPSPPEEYIYQNLQIRYPSPVQAFQYPQLLPQAGLHENIYMNTVGVDANGKPSLVPSIMTMQDRIQLLDRNPVHFSHSTSENSLAQTSSLGDINSVSEFNQHYMNNRVLKEDVV